jgi:asparagine synthase (glutamine-hydrolysing)
MTDRGGRNWLCFNGEIYNYQALAQRYLSPDERSDAKGDAAVLLRLLAKNGAAILSELRGMFAFAFVDADRKTVLLVRDPFGIKPLFYAVEEGTLLFSSELWSTRKMLKRVELNPSGLGSFLATGSVAEATTGIEPIKSLCPGSLLEVSLESHSGEQALTQERWWNVGIELETSLRESNTEFSRDLVSSIEAHFVSDVPVGIFLSGGIDSSVLAYHAKHTLGYSPHCLTVVFDEAGYDESVPVREFAAAVDLDVMLHRATANSILAGLDDFFLAMQEPTVDGLNSFVVSRHAREASIKVALSGLGADELAGGYASFRRIPLLERVAALPGKDLLVKLLSTLPGSDSRYVRKLITLLTGPVDTGVAYDIYRGLFSGNHLGNSGIAAWLQSFSPRPIEPNISHLPDFFKISYLEFTRYLGNQLLPDTDSFSMRSSLEVRVPYVDVPLFRSAMSSASRDPRTRRNKAMLLETLPIGLRRHFNGPKQGFTLPMEPWLRAGPLRNEVFSGEVYKKFGDLFPHQLRMKFRDQFDHRRLHWSRPWSLYVLARWMDKFASQSGVAIA